MRPFLIPDQQAPLVLTAMTLRGIGSYLRGARLKIRPLTILCGKNGSGKSTWLKALNLLKESLEANRLPYGFSRIDSANDGIEFTNAFYFLASPENHGHFDSPEDAADFGPPGTIGLELFATHDAQLLDVPSCDFNWKRLPECTNDAQEFLWGGHCREGMHLQLRVAHPGHDKDPVETPHLVDLIELRLNHEYILRLEGRREPAQQFGEGQSGPRRSFPYTLSCSAGFLPKTHQHVGDVVKVGDLIDINRRQWTNLLDGIEGAYATALLDHFEARFCQVLKLALDGVFHIGAIRRTHDSLALEAITEIDAKHIVFRRHVGTDGEHSWRLERAFGGNRMRAVEVNEIRPNEVGKYSDRILNLFSVNGSDSRARRILAAAPTKVRERIEKLADSGSANIHDGAGGISGGECGDYSHQEVASLLAAFLNSVLESRTLFERDVWRHHFGEDIGCVLGLAPDPEIRYLAEKGIENLDLRRLRRLNSLLVRDAITFGQERDGFDETLAQTNDTYLMVSYLSRWLNRLTEAGLKTPREPEEGVIREGEPPAHVWGNVPETPTGLLLDPQHPSSFIDEPDDKLVRLIHPCFGPEHQGFAQPPRQLSAGFHQVFPIVVQLGLMRAGELLAIENPEVHLHPGLQLNLTAALIKHASSGRRLIIETHSDLVVRRVLRAIMQEEDGLGQSQVGIYFADTHPEENGYDSSTLNQLQINDRGQIDNWPSGFMDDDVKESRRLMDAMYGSDQEDEEPEQ